MISARASTISPRLPRSRTRAVRVVAAQPPSGVSSPKRQPNLPKPIFGFVENAERMNSRAAMVGFIALLMVEAVSHQGLLDLIGVETGKGIGFSL